MSTGATSFGDHLEVRTLAERVSEQIAKTIIDNNLVAGDKLPSERELCDTFGVSRTVVREALRGLAARGLVTVRSGVGASVASADASLVTDTLRSFLRGADELGYARVHEVRLMLELQIASMACLHATEHDLQRLELIHASMAGDISRAEAAAIDVEFHRMIATATHNPLYGILLDSLRDVLVQVRQNILEVPGRAHRGYEYHDEILSAIRRRDADAAREHMREHLEDVSKTLGADEH